MTESTHGSSGGVELTEELVDELSREAEQGFPESQLTRRGPGRPSMGRGAATVFHVRLEPELRAAVDEQARKEDTTASEVARRAIKRYVTQR